MNRLASCKVNSITPDFSLNVMATLAFTHVNFLDSNVSVKSE